MIAIQHHISSMSFLLSPSKTNARPQSSWTWIVGGILLTFTTLKPALSQSIDFGALNQTLQNAVAVQNWDSAIQIIDEMIQLAPEKRQSLEQYRNQLSTLQSTQTPQAFKTTAPNRAGQVPIKRREIVAWSSSTLNLTTGSNLICCSTLGLASP